MIRRTCVDLLCVTVHNLLGRGNVWVTTSAKRTSVMLTVGALASGVAWVSGRCRFGTDGTADW